MILLSVLSLSFFRWAVENQIGKKDLVINQCDAKQSVYIYGCKDSVLQVQGSFYTFKTYFLFVFMVSNVTLSHLQLILLLF